MYQQLIKRRKAVFLKGSTYFLERALLFSFCIHAVAMLSMLLLLLAGMPGGPNADVAARMAYVASHPWLWRLGWLPWMLTALSGLLISLALLRVNWRVVGLLTLLLWIVGIVPDQMGQVLWMTQGIELAQQGSVTLYSQFESTVFLWISVFGGTFYTFGAIGWTWCLATQGQWRWTRGMSIYSALTWFLFIFISLDPLLPGFLYLTPFWIAVGNGLAFLLLLIWLMLVTEIVLRGTRPDQVVGRFAPWHCPGAGRVLNPIGNSRFLRTLCEYVPVVAFLSDVTDVIYVNYIVEASKLESLVPTGLELERIGPDGHYAFFTFLTFKHGHFGPRFLGKLRRLLPSPVQTNWRIHVKDPHTGQRGIFFVSNAIASTFHALAARLLSEGMPMHVLQAGGIYSDNDGNVSLYLDGGRGSAPDAQAIFQRLDERPEQGPWSLCFASYKEMLAYCVPQDRALSTQPWYARVTRQEIELSASLDACEPLEGRVYSRTAHRFVGAATPFCFYIPRVQLHFEYETYDPLEQ